MYESTPYCMHVPVHNSGVGSGEARERERQVGVYFVPVLCGSTCSRLSMLCHCLALYRGIPTKLMYSKVGLPVPAALEGRGCEFQVAKRARRHRLTGHTPSGKH
jgi:hypothetical protein